MEPCSLPISPVTVPSSCTKIFPLDHTIKGVGKRRGENKREVFWRFAIEETITSQQQQPEQPILDKEDAISPSNRNSTNTATSATSSTSRKEYTIMLLWSFSSGKQSLSVNGVEEYFTRRKGASVFDHSFEYDGLKLQVIGTRVKPNKAPSNFRCFELLIDGTSLFACLPPDGGDNSASASSSDDHQQHQEQSTGGVIFHPSPSSVLSSTVERYHHDDNTETTTPMSILHILYPDHQNSIEATHKASKHSASASNQQEKVPSSNSGDDSVIMFEPVGSSMQSLFPPSNDIKTIV